MSWMPDKDPVLGDKASCDALELVIVPRTRDLGDGFAVRRALPHGKRQMVGPFIFFDHFGPVQFIAGKGMDVRPHPHIGLATVTYLFDGKIMHRDSEGNAIEIMPGAMNLMTAGRGIAHSECTPVEERRSGQNMFGIQSWIALPQADEEIVPSFQHFAAEHLPVVEDCGVPVNPAIVEGQVRGGVAQAIGAVLLEHAAYDEDGQFVAATFMDYLLPTSTVVPRIEVHHVETVATDPDVNFRGVGERGMILAPAAIVNAMQQISLAVQREITKALREVHDQQRAQG